MKKYLVSWTEYHEIEVKADNEDQAHDEAMELSAQKDTTQNMDNLTCREVTS